MHSTRLGNQTIRVKANRGARTDLACDAPASAQVHVHQLPYAPATAWHEPVDAARVFAVAIHQLFLHGYIESHVGPSMCCVPVHRHRLPRWRKGMQHAHSRRGYAPRLGVRHRAPPDRAGGARGGGGRPFPGEGAGPGASLATRRVQRRHEWRGGPVRMESVVDGSVP